MNGETFLNLCAAVATICFTYWGFFVAYSLYNIKMSPLDYPGIEKHKVLIDSNRDGLRELPYALGGCLVVRWLATGEVGAAVWVGVRYTLLGLWLGILWASGRFYFWPPKPKPVNFDQTDD